MFEAMYTHVFKSGSTNGYNLFSQELSMITWPSMYQWEHANCVLMGMEDGVLGCASLQESRLELWAMEFGTDGGVKWALRRVVELENWLPSCSSYVINFADGVGVFFVRTGVGIFTVELKSGRVKKISRRNDEVIPYMRFYTPDQSGGIMPPSTMASSENVETARDEHRNLLLPHSSGEVSHEDGVWEEEKKCAQDLFEDGSEAFEEGYFGHAQSCFSGALDRMVLYYGRLSTMCISTYYKYGLALMYEAQSKNATYQDWVMGTTSRVDTRSSNASGSNIWKGDTGKDWVMGTTSRVDTRSSNASGSNIWKGDTGIGDIDYSLRTWFKALAILEHLVEPDHCRIILLNFHIFLAFISASKIGDAIPYRAKVISLYKSRMQKLKKANEACLADKGDNASAAEVDSEKSLLDKEIEFLTSIFTVLDKKLEDLAQSMLTPISRASGAHNVGYAAPGAASLVSEIAGPSNSMSTAPTMGTSDLGAAGHASNRLMSRRSLLNLAARNLKRILHL